jgi:hypothetical protein
LLDRVKSKNLGMRLWLAYRGSISL